ncbi:Phosphate regulon transcriptional regulatory protein PhoB [Aquisphaera giovannonii]|uniref:Phosphate regulon transcriptional regulatory protein PhoB n=1 Tax=Aquisphaera giovannonii TaxID=406548 RepID=A0A5B9VYX8_9BACT|nr:response regulator [Aquisphaera giovannonii]QEH33151.1 Phosphate regulon transcriptional regulatory protein PhoB [Aquisphaera giovannonii]
MAARRILLIEDSSTMRRMLDMMLKREGFEVRTAVDGEDGLAKAREEPLPELILTDHEMPGLDGSGVCREVKKDGVLKAIPIIIMTTLGEVEKEAAAREAGADDYIQKPKSPDEVKEMVERIHKALEAADLVASVAERNRQLEAKHKKLID